VISFPQINETLGKYRIISVLGKGTTATVYKASHKYLNVEVALKVLSPQLVQEDESIRERFLEEAMNHAKLSHNNFVRIIDVENEDKYTYIVMEYIDGAALDDILKLKEVIPPLQAIKIILEVCKALKYALELNIIHRDIKPGNIIITKNSEVKLADFGLAKSIHEPDKHHKIQGQIFGTPFYMSPEQFVDSAGVDHHSDLYSLGATIYHMVTGKLPFETESLTEIISMHLNKIPEPPAMVNPEVNIPFSDIIMKLLEKKPADRYQNYLELIRDLEEVEQVYKTPGRIQSSFPEESDTGSETNILKKYERYQKFYINFNESGDITRELVNELEQTKAETPEEQKLKDKILDNLKSRVKDFSNKPDIDSYVSQNVKDYLKNLGNDSKEIAVSDRLQKKYQKYFKQFQGVELENVLMNKTNQEYFEADFDFENDEVLIPLKNVKIELPENLKNRTHNPPVIRKAAVQGDISKDLNQSFEKFNQENQVKISASKYIQKFKKLFEK
jgi:serine/threonine protein kinase